MTAGFHTVCNIFGQPIGRSTALERSFPSASQNACPGLLELCRDHCYYIASTQDPISLTESAESSRLHTGVVELAGH
jgi:hypothetical protein